MERFRRFAYKVSRNHTRTCWVLKCDIRKFFASIDQNRLIEITYKYIKDSRTIELIREIVQSFYSTGLGKGLPLGNLTSQLLVNAYMNEFDQFAKHKLKAQYYIRYADDFVILSRDKGLLEGLIPQIKEFLETTLKLCLHPNKVYIKTFASGVDFLGWVHFPDHRVIRTASKKRMIRNLKGEVSEQKRVSYLGLLTHGNARKIRARYL